MLARQAWRLVMAPDSPCAQLLMAKYCPNGRLMEADEGPGISYSWRSIVQGIKASRKGIIWRVGDGEQIRIWEDPWLPRGATRRPITPRGAALLSKVSELIDPVTGSWDVQLLNDIFWEEDVKEIMLIPVRVGHDDYVAWHFDSKGIFSIRSAYHVLDDQRERDARRQRGESSGSSSDSPSSFKWKKIWKLTCPPKVKQFVWRLSHNSLALKMNIRRRSVLV
jgi:hypothetical protein